MGDSSLAISDGGLVDDALLLFFCFFFPPPCEPHLFSFPSSSLFFQDPHW